MNRYINVLTRDKVTKLQQYEDEVLENDIKVTKEYVLYRKDKPQYIEYKKMGSDDIEIKEYYEFFKPLYVWEQTYKEIES